MVWYDSIVVEPEEKRSGQINNVCRERTCIAVRALVAQGIEQRFPVPRVGGSNPSGCAFLYM